MYQSAESLPYALNIGTEIVRGFRRLRLTKTIPIILALTAVPLLSCAEQGNIAETSAAGITVRGPFFKDDTVELQISSTNPEFDCLNLNGIFGSGPRDEIEELAPEGTQITTLPKIEYPILFGGDALYSTNAIKGYARDGPDVALFELEPGFKKVTLSNEYKFASFAVFNCEKFRQSRPMKVYHYSSGPLVRNSTIEK